MVRSQFTLIGLLLAMLLMLHAAMLAGGGHSVEAHDVSTHLHHGATSMSATPSAPQGFEPPRAQLPEMGECGLLGVAALRVDIALDAAPVEAPIAMPTAALDLLAMYAPFVSAISRSQLQVFLI